MLYNSFIHEDYTLAQEAFSKWQAEKHETVDQYVMRKRKAQLRQLVKKVIVNELDEYEQKLVDLHWYKDISKDEIATLLNIDRSTVYRHFDKINNIIFEKLKYAIEYRFGIENDEGLNLIIASKQLSSSKDKPEDTADRIKQLRKAQLLDLKTLSRMMDISEQRLNRLEKKLEYFTLNDIKEFSKIFQVSTDFLIFGKS